MCSPADHVHRRLDLLRRGYSRAEIEQASVSGALVRLRRGIFADADVCEPRRRAAQHGGALACLSAACHRGLWVLADDEPIHVGLEPKGHGHRHESCTCVEHWDHDGRSRFDLPSTERMLRQILTCSGVEGFFVALESALHKRAIGRADLSRLAQNTSPVVREAIALARDDAESGLESLLRWRLRHLRLDISTQVSLYSVGRIDLLIGDALVVEVDGVENHSGPERRHKDLMRDAQAAAWGFVTLRFDYAMVVHDWPTVEAAILGHVSRRLHRR